MFCSKLLATRLCVEHNFADLYALRSHFVDRGVIRRHDVSRVRAGSGREQPDTSHSAIIKYYTLINTTQPGKNGHAICQKISAKTSYVQFTQANL